MLDYSIPASTSFCQSADFQDAKIKDYDLRRLPIIFVRNFQIAMNKQLFDILGIVLPALIILLGIMRLFTKKTRGVNGLITFLAILLLVVGLIQFYVFPARKDITTNGKAIPLAVSKHSDAFNQSAENLLSAYFNVTETFAGKDTAAITQSLNGLETAVNNFQVQELQVDTLIYQTALQPYENLKTELASMRTDPSIAEKRSSLNIFSNELFALLSTIRYDLAKLHWLECADAFGEGRPGNWVSKSESAANPYGQQNCVETKTTLNFVAADSTKKL